MVWLCLSGCTKVCNRNRECFDAMFPERIIIREAAKVLAQCKDERGKPCELHVDDEISATIDPGMLAIRKICRKSQEYYEKYGLAEVGAKIIGFDRWGLPYIKITSGPEAIECFFGMKLKRGEYIITFKKIGQADLAG